ncbi:MULTISPECIES: hypothetical protein [unclassified Streptomyces]|uniref:hypothetical protein n=1 Tax=unclassified Streptomyces TaxID=2593676 RepID=UPI002885F98B|nr:hypothetical protein [Streptomyces sp. DSM 41633]
MEIADDIPVCCDDDTDAVKLGNGGIEYSCGDCRTILEFDNSGLVSDLREKAAL